jgi:hypothetical protein
MQDAGHQVGILTSHKIIHEPADLALLEKRGFPQPDFYIGRPLDSQGIDYAILKSLAIRENRIDIHFDDGDAEKLRNLLGEESYKLITVMPRGREDEHFE